MEATRAILLRKYPWSETSLIVSWLTERFGTIKTVARGARKPGNALAGKLDLLFDAEISFSLSSKGDLHALREVQIVAVFDARRAGSAGFYLASYFSELAGLAAPAMHPAREIFDLLRRAIAHLQEKAATMRALHHFERELCIILGVHDPSGRVSAAEALFSLYGSILPSRAAAVRFLEMKNSPPAN